MRRSFNFFSFLLFALFFSSLSGQKSAVTTRLNGGRFGDNLLNFIKTKWIAHTYDLDFYYVPFKYSDQLVLHDLEKKYSRAIHKNFRRAINITNDNNVNANSGILYVSTFYFKAKSWGNWYYDMSTWQGLIDNKVFFNELRRVIQPKKLVKKVDLPKDRISVAVHVRKGGGFDLPILSPQQYDTTHLVGKKRVVHSLKGKMKYTDVEHPLNHPPDQFYMEEVIKLSEMLDDAPLYVHIFTDEPRPQEIVQLYKQKVNKPNIMWGCREQGNHHDSNVLDDFFALTQFDCLIRPQSSFSKAAQLIADFKVVIYPISSYWIGNTLVMDEIKRLNLLLTAP